MEDSVIYRQALKAYKDFLNSVFQEVTDFRQRLFDDLSEYQKNKVRWFLYNQSRNVRGSVLQHAVKPPRIIDFAPIPSITELEYTEYIDVHYKKEIMENSVRNQEYKNEKIKSLVVSEILQFEQASFNNILSSC